MLYVFGFRDPWLAIFPGHPPLAIDIAIVDRSAWAPAVLAGLLAGDLLLRAGVPGESPPPDPAGAGCAPGHPGRVLVAGRDRRGPDEVDESLGDDIAQLREGLEEAGLDPSTTKVEAGEAVIALWVRAQGPSWRVGTHLPHSELALLLAYLLVRSWDAELALVTAVHNRHDAEPAEDYLRERSRAPGCTLLVRPRLRGRERLRVIGPGRPPGVAHRCASQVSNGSPVSRS